MPYAHIGVRDTQVAGNARKKETFIVLEKPDDPEPILGHAILSTTIQDKVVETHLTEFGFGSVIKKGEAPSAPFKLQERDLNKILKKLEKPRRTSHYLIL